MQSSNPDVPQALWFHQHARGPHRHSGRLHYHLEYLIRKSTDRKIIRSKPISNDAPKTEPHDTAEENEAVEDMEELVIFL